MNSIGIVEAALFSAKDYLKAKEISKNTGVPEDEVLSGLKSLQKSYEKRESAIVILKTSSGYRMTLRKEYVEYAEGFSQPNMSKAQMGLLTFIGCNQPVLQSELSNRVGPKIYDIIPTLVDLGFVSKKRSGQTWELSVTKKFAETYGIKSNKKEDICEWTEKNRKH